MEKVIKIGEKNDTALGKVTNERSSTKNISENSIRPKMTYE